MKPFGNLLACLAAGILAAGCTRLDPSVYGSSAGQKSSVPPQTAAAAKPQAPAPTPEKKLPFGATPRAGETFWGLPQEGDLLAKSPDNVGIIVEKLDAATANALDMGGSFRARSGNVEVAGGNPLAAKNGLLVRVGSGAFTGRLGASATHTRSSTREQMFIVVKSGTEGALVMGNDVFVTRLGYWTPWGYQLIAERQFVGRQLAVRPTILPGGQITIELWPRFSTRRGQVIDVTQLATRVVVRDGQPLIIGGLDTAESEVSAVLFGLGSREATGTSALMLTAKTGGLDLGWPKGR